MPKGLFAKYRLKRALERHSPEVIEACRSLFRGRFKQAQVDGLNQIVSYGFLNGYSRAHLAYALATAHHETGRRMQPIREGFCKTDAGSRRAVASLHAKGIILRNYALPAGPFQQSYYGRGLVQITWYDNYRKFGELLGIPLAEQPDLSLEWEHTLPLLFIGMRDGLYTGKSLSDYNLPADFRGARRIINGDVRKNGEMIAGYARQYYEALEVLYA